MAIKRRTGEECTCWRVSILCPSRRLPVPWETGDNPDDAVTSWPGAVQDERARHDSSSGTLAIRSHHAEVQVSCTTHVDLEQRARRKRIGTRNVR